MTSDRIDGGKTPDKIAAADLTSEVLNRGSLKSESTNALETKSSTASSLSPLTITDNQAKAGAENKSGPTEANTLLLQAADETVNKSIYKLPAWASLSKPSPGLGCVSSFSNRYREAMHLAGIIDSTDDKQYRKYYQVNMDDLNKVMGRDNLLSRIPNKDIKEGDIIEGVTPDTSKRHMGIVGRIENGQRMVYDNYGGNWLKEPLDLRFGQYKENNYFRAYLPPKS